MKQLVSSSVTSSLSSSKCFIGWKRKIEFWLISFILFLFALGQNYTPILHAYDMDMYNIG